MICVQSIRLSQFRCFSQIKISLDAPVVLITGANGTGKTTILEALVYASTLRSFRSSTPAELIQDSKLASVLYVEYIDDLQEQTNVHVELTKRRRIVRINNKCVTKPAELFDVVRVVSITEHDIQFVQGSPEARRYFLDYGLMLHDPTYATLIRRYKRLLDQRNAWLRTGATDKESWHIWTQGILDLSVIIRQKRSSFLSNLTTQVCELQSSMAFSCPPIQTMYAPHLITCTTLGELVRHHEQLCARERYAQRTLFGAHLDDVCLKLGELNSRIAASRGQQRLVAILFKLAQSISLLNEGQRVILVIDDLMADFDERRLHELLRMLRRMPCQLVLAATQSSPFLLHMCDDGIKHVQLTSSSHNEIF